jgi:hypothetical protein
MAPSPLVPDLDVVEIGPAHIDLRDVVGAEAWLDGDGAVYARCQADGDRYCVDLPAVAAFHFDRRGARVAAAKRPGVDDRAVADAYRRGALPLVLHARGSEVVHASAVVGPAGVIAFCGASRAGKSTVAYGLSRHGYPLWADDIVALDVAPASITALALPFDVRLRPASAAMFGALPPAPANRSGAAHAGRGSAPATRCAGSTAGASRRDAEADRALPLAAICLLARRGDASRSSAAAALRRVSPSAAYPGVLAQAFCFRLDDADRKRAMLERYLALIARTPVFELIVADDLTRLPEVLDTIDRALGKGNR